MDRHTTPIMDMDLAMGQDMDMAIIMGKFCLIRLNDKISKLQNLLINSCTVRKNDIISIEHM
jgi:hypothetical protein